MSYSSGTTSSGSKANKTGNELEWFVENTLLRRGYTEFQGNKKQAFANRNSISGKQYIKQLHVGDSIYETKRKVDFFIVNKNKYPDGFIIECKWQQSAGTTDEKYPFLLFNILKTGVPTVILLDGGGYKPAAEAWLKNQANKKINRALWHVWNMAEFRKEVNNGFLG